MSFCSFNYDVMDKLLFTLLIESVFLELVARRIGNFSIFRPLECKIVNCLSESSRNRGVANISILLFLRKCRREL